MPLAWCVKFKDPNALIIDYKDQINVYCEQRILPIFGGGLETLGIIFSVITSSILKISLSIW